MYDKAKAFDELIFKMQTMEKNEKLFYGTSENQKNLNTIQSLIGATKANNGQNVIDLGPNTWYQAYTNDFDRDNCLKETRILADHRYKLKLHRA